MNSSHISLCHLNWLESLVRVQVFIACGIGKSGGQAEDPFRKPNPGMWHLMDQHFNSGISIDMDQLFSFLSPDWWLCYYPCLRHLPTTSANIYNLPRKMEDGFSLLLLTPHLYLSDLFMLVMRLGEKKIIAMLTSNLHRYCYILLKVILHNLYHWCNYIFWQKVEIWVIERQLLMLQDSLTAIFIIRLK